VRRNQILKIKNQKHKPKYRKITDKKIIEKSFYIFKYVFLIFGL